MPKALELTWVASLKQWRKRRTVNGKSKTFYLGKGTGKDDRLSYGRALAKWREIAKGIDLAERGSELQRQYHAWRDELASRPDIDPSIYFEQTVSEIDPTKPPHPSIERWMNGTARMGEDRFANPSTPRHSSKPTKTLGQCIDAYIEDQRGRYEHGLRFPSAPQRERISGLRFMSYRYNATLLKTDWHDEPVPEDEASLAALMKRFRENQKALMAAGKIEPGTVNERTKTMRHVVRWLHDQYLIPALPRQMVHLCAAYGVKTTAKALDLDTLHRLWNGASPRLKTYMSLALNCGFYVGDIASLEYSHIQGGYIFKNRHKTGVPTRFKLWSVTKALLDANANGNDKLVLVTDQGGPLLVIDPYWKNGRGRRWCKIETDLLATRKRLGINGVTFSKFRDTSSTQIESIDRTVTDLFDGHKDARMARFYVDGEMVDYDRLFAALDAAMDQLERYYALELTDLQLTPCSSSQPTAFAGGAMPTKIRQTIQAYHGEIVGVTNHRYRSWEHCFDFFQRTKAAGVQGQREHAALQLAFYLASWGMYRGSCWLLQYDYTVHLPVMDCLTNPAFSSLWNHEVGSGDGDAELIPTILAAVESVRQAYQAVDEPTNLLITKALLGTLGCIPAFDKYVTDGMKSEGLPC